MILKPCPFCHKDIPRAITACPYCRRDEKGQPVLMDSSLSAASGNEKLSDHDLQELASDDPFIRDQAVRRTAQLGVGLVPQLIGILSDHAKPGLAGVATVLGKIADRRAIPALAQAAKMGDEDLRMAAVWALSQFHDPEVLPYLLSESDRPHPMIQSYLAGILGTFQDKKVIPVLAKLAGHPNREVAFQASCALGEVGDAEGIGPLRKAWRRRDSLIRAASAASLRKLGSKPTWMSPLSILLAVAGLAAAGAGIGWMFYK